MNIKRLSKVNIQWSSPFSYALGLLATDGNLSPDKRHINFTTKDESLAIAFKTCLGLHNKIGRKGRGGSREKKYYVIQFGDRNFYEFLIGIGITPAKSKTLAKIDIPSEYFADFFRGCIDGDGSIGAYMHPESRHPQIRIRLCSASLPFLEWIKRCITTNVGIRSGWIEKKVRSIYVLIYGKTDSIKLFEFMYYPGVQYYLGRKYERALPYILHR